MSDDKRINDDENRHSTPDASRDKLNAEIARRIRKQIVSHYAKPNAGADNPDQDEKVGYKSPPTHTRFKPGQSGNPKGRPKNVRSTASRRPDDLPEVTDVMLRQLEQIISVRDGDRLIEISVLEATIRAQQAAALKGSVRAQQQIIESARRAKDEEAAWLEQHHAFWTSFQVMQREELDKQIAAGEKDPQVYPHPDDIVLKRGKRVRIVGPLDEEHAKHFTESQHLRDLMLMHYELDNRSARIPADEDAIALLDSIREQLGLRLDDPFAKVKGYVHEDDDPGGFFIAMWLNSLLPERMRIGEEDWYVEVLKVRRMTKRELLKATREGWRQLGVRVKRGATLPPWSLLRRLLYLAIGLLKLSRSPDYDPEHVDAVLGTK